MSLKLAVVLLYSSFILLTLYQIYRDYRTPCENSEFIVETLMSIFEVLGLISEFISIPATVLCYSLLLLFTVIDIFMHKEDD